MRSREEIQLEEVQLIVSHDRLVKRTSSSTGIRRYRTTKKQYLRSSVSLVDVAVTYFGAMSGLENSEKICSFPGCCSKSLAVLYIFSFVLCAAPLPEKIVAV